MLTYDKYGGMKPIVTTCLIGEMDSRTDIANEGAVAERGIPGMNFNERRTMMTAMTMFMRRGWSRSEG